MEIAPHTSQEGLLAEKKRRIWEELSQVTVAQAVLKWSEKFVKNTQITYRTAFNYLYKNNIIEEDKPLSIFSLVNHSVIISKIKNMAKSKGSAQARLAAYISFTKFLNRITEGVFPAAIPVRSGIDKTFYPIREKVVSEPITSQQWEDLTETLLDLGKIREYLICCLLLHGGKRISEVLSLRIENINWSKNEITFLQRKTMHMEKHTCITYSAYLMDVLKKFVNGRTQGWVFPGKTDSHVSYTWVRRFLSDIAKDIGFHFNTHQLRTTCVTKLISLGASDEEIQRITGHATPRQMRAYDKNDLAMNVSKKFDLLEEIKNG